MDKTERLKLVVEHLAEQFSCGDKSVSRDDTMSSGVKLRSEVAFVVNGFSGSEAEALGAADLMTGLSDMLSTWGGGFELASADDFVTDDETLEDVVMGYAETLGAEPAHRP